MPFNGSGTFTVVNIFVPNTTILSAAVNQNFSDIATGLSDCLTRDGQAGMSAVFRAVSGSVSAPGITFNADATSGLFLSATGVPGFVAKSLGFLLNSSVFQATAATVQTGGSNYAVGDTITLTGGTAINQAVVTVATLTGTAVATVTVTYPGNYTVVPSNPVAQGSTSGLGSGCTLNLTFAAQFARSVVTDEAGNAVWQRLGASSFVSGLMAYANGVDFVNGIGAANVAAATGLSAPPPGASFKNLAIDVATNTTVSASADFVVTTNGTKYQTTPLSSTINLGTTGANALDTGTIAIDTWYAIWGIAKPDGTTAGLASTSATSPTMPSGYTYKSRIGWVRTQHGSAILFTTRQRGRRAQYAPVTGAYPVVATGSLVSSTVSVSNFVPTTASEISLAVVYSGGANRQAGVAPSGAVGSTSILFINNTTGGSLMNGTTPVTFVLESTNISVSLSNTGEIVSCTGWNDNL